LPFAGAHARREAARRRSARVVDQPEAQHRERLLVAQAPARLVEQRRRLLAAAVGSVPPAPSSATSTTTRSGPCVTSTRTHVAPAYLTAFESASLTR
jgi:hypothetical protein